MQKKILAIHTDWVNGINSQDRMAREVTQRDLSMVSDDEDVQLLQYIVCI
jgi:hypothetical protein